MKKILITTIAILLCVNSFAYNATIFQGENKQFVASIITNYVGCYTGYSSTLRNLPAFVTFTENAVNCLSTTNPYTGLTSYNHKIDFNLSVPSDAAIGNYTFYIDFVLTGFTTSNVTLQIDLTVCAIVGQATKPTGTSALCLNPANTDYSTTDLANATLYSWTITPASAGTISGTGKTATVDWSNTYVGDAQISVKGQNDCGLGLASDNLTVTIGNVPAKPSKPNGNVALCINPANDSYTTTATSLATSYVWAISPTTAGIISGTGTTAIIYWSDTYAGDVQITVSGLNSCGQGIISDILTVTIGKLPLQPTKPSGTTSLFLNPSNTNYASTATEGATSYVWTILPVTAGTITGTGTTVTVDWTNTYSGDVQISVKGQNTCGLGIASENLTVTIFSVPLQAAKPSGLTSLCINPYNSSYTTIGATGATSYIWTILPVSAGTITGTGTTGAVDWSNTYSGDAQISVKGTNGSGDGISSENLTVAIGTIPSQAAKPTGTETLCINPPDGNYTTAGASGAISYIWTISPSGAGTISGTGTAATVNWSNIYTGQAQIYAKGSNNCGQGLISENLTVTINNVPGQAAKPSGTTSICINPPNNNYTTTGSNGATTYSWTISPSQAGTISGTGATATVDWSETFSGQAQISVKGENSCGQGLSSDNLIITIRSLPTQAAKPVGTSNLCINSQNNNYITTGASGANTYSWIISPSQAGTISGTGTTATIDWSETFIGDAQISVKGENSCGQGPVSEILTVTISNVPGQASKPTGTTTLCVNPSNTTYTTNGADRATNYSWILSPVQAGTIGGTGTTATIDWSNTFTGDAQISVKGENSCGQGLVSEILPVTISSVPGQAAKPSGTSTLCVNPLNINYSTTGAEKATTYSWALSPVEAGTISGTGTTATFDWSNTFTGDAIISVKGENSCGQGLASEILKVTIGNVPIKASKPTGTATLCLNPANNDYSTLGATGASTYGWSISPSLAGTITGTGTTATVDWSNTYTGDAQISVKGENKCGQGLVSEIFVATISTCTGIETTENENIKMFPNPSDGRVNIESSLNKMLEIEVVNYQGQIIYTAKMTDKIQLNLESGLYIVRIRNGKTLVNKQLIINK